MSELILHHHDPSPFAEKIRLVLGIKGAAWSSVQIPMVMPKPDLTALTGGYRKTPVLQIGADIYCDTLLIAQVLDDLLPDPPLFRSGLLASLGLQHWSDAAVFPPGAALSLHENAAHIPEAVSRDREDYFTFLDFARFEEDAPHFRAQLRAHAALIEAQLADGRAFLFGAAPEWADVCAYFNIWMAGGHIPSAARLFADFSHLSAWRARMDAIGHGERAEISEAEALERARAATPAAKPGAGEDESGARPGDEVSVTACDYGKDPVRGVLVSADDRAIVIARSDPRAGEVAVHVPRLGFRVARGGGAPADGQKKQS
ncbi:MAG: glutathione S-transferase family protein [Caulobacterales bacterium]|nr:glutathione S-transferase family protein [Caulobacterales bacterium]